MTPALFCLLALATHQKKTTPAKPQKPVPTRAVKAGKDTKKPAPTPKTAVVAKPQKPVAKLPVLPPHPAVDPRSLQTALAAAGTPEAVRESGLTNAMVEAVAAGKGRIDYDKGFTRALGLGALPPPTLGRSRAQDTLDARDAALADALRTLTMAVQQVRVTASSRVSSYVLQSDEVRIKLAGAIKNAEVVEEKLLPEAGIYRVIVQIPLTGSGSVSEALSAAGVAAVPAPTPKIDPFAPGAPPPKEATYTGLIVDCRGLRLQRSQSPKLCALNGEEVYGTLNVTADFLNEFGIVAYPTNLEDARQCARIGDRPLIVRARGFSDHERTSPLISPDDANRIRLSNKQDHFLERCAVVFVVDR